MTQRRAPKPPTCGGGLVRSRGSEVTVLKRWDEQAAPFKGERPLASSWKHEAGLKQLREFTSQEGKVLIGRFRTTGTDDFWHVGGAGRVASQKKAGGAEGSWRLASMLRATSSGQVLAWIKRRGIVGVGTGRSPVDLSRRRFEVKRGLGRSNPERSGHQPRSVRRASRVRSPGHPTLHGSCPRCARWKSGE